MTLRCQNAMAQCERRTQEVRIAALFARPRTCYRAGECVLGAGASFFRCLLSLPRDVVHAYAFCNRLTDQLPPKNVQAFGQWGIRF